MSTVIAVNPLPPEQLVAYLTGDSACPSLETVASRICAGRPIEGMSFAELDHGFSELERRIAAARARLRGLLGLPEVAP